MQQQQSIVDTVIKDIIPPVIIPDLHLQPSSTVQEIAQIPQPQEAVIVQKSNALSLLAQYSDSDSELEEEENKAYRKPVELSSSSCSSDSEEELDIKVIEKKIREPAVASEGDSDDEHATARKKREPLKVKGELTISDLPPIQDLQITVDERECMEIGTITTIVDQLGKRNIFPSLCHL